jgi:nucleotide-binding universal stress UspA family protein
MPAPEREVTRVRIVTGLLDTPEGRAARRRAAAEAQLTGGTLVLVVYVPAPHDQRASRTYAADRDTAAQAAQEVAAPLREDGVEVDVRVPVGASSPSDALLTVADDEDAELIVIGMRRRSRVAKLVVGSNAQEILLHADAAVLAVKAEEEEA